MTCGGLDQSNLSSFLHGSSNRNWHALPRTCATLSSVSTAFESNRDNEMMQAVIQQSVARPKEEREKDECTSADIGGSQGVGLRTTSMFLARRVDISLFRYMLEVCQSIGASPKDAMKYDPSMIGLEEWFQLNDFVFEKSFVGSD